MKAEKWELVQNRSCDSPTLVFIGRGGHLHTCAKSNHSGERNTIRGLHVIVAKSENIGMDRAGGKGRREERRIMSGA